MAPKGVTSNYGLGGKPTTAYNPRSNGTMGRAHQALRGNVATCGLPGRGLPAGRPFDPPIAAAPWATRSTPHPTLKATPGQFAFGRGVLLGPKP